MVPWDVTPSRDESCSALPSGLQVEIKAPSQEGFLFLFFPPSSFLEHVNWFLFWEIQRRTEPSMSDLFPTLPAVSALRQARRRSAVALHTAMPFHRAWRQEVYIRPTEPLHSVPATLDTLPILS